jgi:hypothetical protein
MALYAFFSPGCYQSLGNLSLSPRTSCHVCLTRFLLSALLSYLGLDNRQSRERCKLIDEIHLFLISAGENWPLSLITQLFRSVQIRHADSEMIMWYSLESPFRVSFSWFFS